MRKLNKGLYEDLEQEDGQAAVKPQLKFVTSKTTGFRSFLLRYMCAVIIIPVFQFLCMTFNI